MYTKHYITRSTCTLLQVGQSHPAVASAVRGFMLEHLTLGKEVPTEHGKVVFGAAEAISLQHLGSLNTLVQLDLRMKVNGLSFSSDPAAPTARSPYPR